MELSRLLRRGLLVAAVAAAGWLLSVVFAATASADEVPADDTQTQKQQSGGGKLDGLVGGLTGALGGVTDKLADIPGSLVDTSGDILAPIAPPPREPVTDVPSTLPAGSSSGSATTDRDDGASRADTIVTPPPVTEPAAPVVTPPAATVVPPATPVHVAPVVAAPPAPAPPAQDASVATEHADDSAPRPRPVKSPAAPAGSGTAVSQSHDSSGGARGAHGVLPAQATLQPADAGFTTRSRAVNAAGRVAGLPASSPD